MAIAIFLCLTFLFLTWKILSCSGRTISLYRSFIPLLLVSILVEAIHILQRKLSLKTDIKERSFFPVDYFECTLKDTLTAQIMTFCHQQPK